jgi:putative transcription factor
MECSICGKDFPNLNKIELEGTIVGVCDKCVKFGKVVEKKIDYQQIKRYVSFKPLIENEIKLVSEYGALIKKSREAKGLARIDFAKRINEKESVIKRIEEEEMGPDDELMKSIENFLKIKLTEDYEDAG